MPDEIAPGLYRVGTYYARRDADDDIIANDLVSDGFTLMLVAPTDVTVTIQGGAIAVADSSPIDPTTKTDGTYLVGVDIAPGKYVITPGDAGMAYYARLDDHLEIIANDLLEGRLLLTVRSTDFAIKFDGHLQPA